MPTMERGRVSLNSMKFYGYHGCLPQERVDGQPYFVDVDFFLPLEEAARQDDLSRTIDYGPVYEAARQVVEETRRNLIEAVAYEVAEKLMGLYNPDRIVVRVRKPRPPVGGFVEHAEAEVVLTR